MLDEFEACVRRAGYLRTENAHLIALALTGGAASGDDSPDGDLTPEALAGLLGGTVGEAAP